MLELYENLTHEIDPIVEGALRANPNIRASHAAMNFYAHVWFDGEQWHSEIHQYRSVVDELTGESAADVIEQANDIYGSG
jgi:hypothetical protein